MDRRRQIVSSAFGAIAAAVLVAVACSHAPATIDQPKASDIRSLRWLSKDADKVKFLTTLPMTCRNWQLGAEEINKIELGRLAFESPALLGGGAARMGLSCSSCHLNGRGNPDFFVEGVSGAPGTADVTSSIFSKVRGDGNFNPVPIPDVAMRDGKQIRDRKRAEFRAKVHGLVVEEFDGQEPPPLVFDALLAYLDSLDPSLCPAGSDRIPIGVFSQLDSAGTAYREAIWRLDFDAETRVFYMRVARFELERVYERLAGANLAPLRRDILAASEAIGGRIEAVRAGAGPSPDGPDWIDLDLKLKAASAKSLYDPDIVRAAFAEE